LGFERKPPRIHGVKLYVLFQIGSQLNLRLVLSGSVAVAAFVGAASLALAQEHSPFPVPQARPPMRTLVDQMSPQERMELRKQLRQHAREHGSMPQTAPAGAPQINRPQPMPPVIQNLPPQNPPPQNPAPQQNSNSAKETDRLTGIERAQLRAQLREAKMREEQDREIKQPRRNNGNKGGNGDGRQNQPPPKQ
jgi:hypothetical protein